MKLIGRDVFFVQRQLWIDSLQTTGSSSEIKSLVYWVVTVVVAH